LTTKPSSSSYVSKFFPFLINSLSCLSYSSSLSLASFSKAAFAFLEEAAEGLEDFLEILLNIYILVL